MADPRFFVPARTLTLTEIAELAGGELGPGTDPAQVIHGAAPLDVATGTDISFAMSARYADRIAQSQAAAFLVTRKVAEKIPAGSPLILCENPQSAYAEVARRIYPAPRATGAISPAAQLSPCAEIGDGTQIDAGAVIGARARIGAGCVIGANTVIGAGCEIGADCRIGPNVTLSHSLIGAGVVIHPGTCIGQDGFGFIPGPGGLEKIPQLGRACIGDGVEIGAGCTIDRGAGADTTIGAGTKIDNHVHIAHNCVIGRHCIIVAQCGLAGSVRLGDGVFLGGAVAVADHVSIGAGARVAATSGVTKDIPEGATWAGAPAQDARDWRREIAAIRRLRRSGATPTE